MDKKNVLLVVGIGCLLLAPILLSRLKSPAKEGRPEATAPATVERTDETIAASRELQSWLYEPSTHIMIKPPQDVHAFFRYQNKYGHPGSRGIRVEVDEDVQGNLGGDWRGVAWKSILDSFCAQNNCRWRVIAPTTIRISVEAATAK
ncbi:MAG: hypothetical protein HZB26_22795 [Candidatus Hydrogenedentes bacterium]|nr:hypothetical protein [Candidatus Hydrogenedentota bacterium]